MTKLELHCWAFLFAILKVLVVCLLGDQVWEPLKQRYDEIRVAISKEIVK